MRFILNFNRLLFPVFIVFLLVTLHMQAYADSKPPIKFEVYNADKTTWASVEKDLMEYCGDSDGCRIKLLMHHEIDRTDQVRCIEEFMYMEQKNLSRNHHKGVRGWTRQMGGGNYSWITGTSATYTICSPWDWSYILNYKHRYAGGEGKAFKNPYEFSFLAHPYVRLNVIVYDE